MLGAAYGLKHVTGYVHRLVHENELSFTADNKTFTNTWPDVTKTFTLVYQYGRNIPVMKVVTQDDDVSVKKGTAPAPYTGQINVKNVLEAGEEIALRASNNSYILRDSHGRLIAVEDKPDDASKFVVEQIGGGNGKLFLLQEKRSKKYVVLSGYSDDPRDKLLQATGSQNEAVKFEVSLSARSAGMRFAKIEEYARLHSDGRSIIVDSVNHWSLSTHFGIAIQKTQADAFLKQRGIEIDFLTPCDEAWLTYIWNLTGGFFLALGLGPFIATGTPEPGVLALIRSNSTAWTAVQMLVTELQTERGATATIASLLSVISILYHEGLLFTVFKMMLSSVGWWAVNSALAKIIELLLIPEREAAGLLSSAVLWVIQTVDAALNVASTCGLPST